MTNVFFVKRIKTAFYTGIVRRKAAKSGLRLKINGKSRVTTTTTLGDNVNFNGMQISGKGDVVIGNNFHSGTGCQMITSFHNYDNGVAIPYDESSIHKNIVIEDNVWIGNSVIILGGGTNWRRSNYSSWECCCIRYPGMCYSRRASCKSFQIQR